MRQFILKLFKVHFVITGKVMGNVGQICRQLLLDPFSASVFLTTYEYTH